MPIRTLIVDDETLARERLRELLAGEPEVEIVGECANGLSAISSIETYRPDLIFLDIQMPEKDGFEVVEQLGSERSGEIIFVTAYDQFALQAFRAHALDYLLKPVDPVALRSALRQLRKRIGQVDDTLSKGLLAAVREIQANRPGTRTISVKSDSDLLILKVDDIDWVESARNHVCFHVGPQSHVARGTMGEIESTLRAYNFVRVHRTAIVNSERIRRIKSRRYGDYQVELHDGTLLAVGRGYKDVLLKTFTR